MEIIDAQQYWASPGPSGQHLRHRLEGPEPLLVGLDRDDVGKIREGLAEAGNELGQHRPAWAEIGAQFVGRHAVGHGLDHLGEGRVGRGPVPLQAVSGQD